MLWTMLTAAMLNVETPDLIAAAQAHFHQLETYRVTVRSSVEQGESQVIRYYYQKPGFIRMEFVMPHRGAVLVYNPQTQKVRLWPFGLNTLPVLTLSPTNPLIRGAQGHRVDRSDVGALLRNIRALQDGGATTMLGEELVGRLHTVQLAIAGGPGQAVNGVHRYQVWLERGTLFPVKVVSFAAGDVPLETVLMDDAEIDVPLPVQFFNP
jgi:hypothetical protein